MKWKMALNDVYVPFVIHFVGSTAVPMNVLGRSGVYFRVLVAVEGFYAVVMLVVGTASCKRFASEQPELPVHEEVEINFWLPS